MSWPLPPSQTVGGRRSGVPTTVGWAGRQPPTPGTGLAEGDQCYPEAQENTWEGGHSQWPSLSKEVLMLKGLFVMPVCSFHVPKTHGPSGSDLPWSNFPLHVHRYSYLYLYIKYCYKILIVFRWFCPPQILRKKVVQQNPKLVSLLSWVIMLLLGILWKEKLAAFVKLRTAAVPGMRMTPVYQGKEHMAAHPLTPLLL